MIVVASRLSRCALRGVALDQSKPRLIANRVIAPDLRDVDLVLGAESLGDIDCGSWHVQVEGDAHPAEVRPLRHRFEMIHGLAGLNFDDPFEALAAIRRCKDEIGEHLPYSDLDACRLFVADVDGDLVFALEAGQQQPDDSVVLELLADGTYQNRTHETSE